MSESGENKNESLIRIAQQSVAVSARMQTVNGVPLTIGSDGKVVVMEEYHSLLAEREPNPWRRKGTSHHTELDSFIEHINRMKEERTTIWADVGRCLFTAIYNYDPAGVEPGAAGWCDHRAKYLCPLSPEWKAWTDRQDEWVSQDEFAEWIDLHAEELTESPGMPKPIELHEMARNLNIHVKGTYSKKFDPVTGNHSLVCKEENTSESTSIPRAFMTALRIFEGGEQYGAEIRLKFRLRNGHAMFLFTIHRHTELQKDAFNEMRGVIAEKTERPVFAGRHD